MYSMKSCIMRLLMALSAVALASMLSTYGFITSSVYSASGVLPADTDLSARDASVRASVLRFIPSNTVSLWAQRDFLIVFGIPSEDNDDRRRRRNLQRTTCWQYNGVARLANNYTGSMLVLYVLGRHPSQNYTYSTALRNEANVWHDILALPLNEGVKTTGKRIGEPGFWGMEAEIGMSRKTFMWYEIVMMLFPSASYYAKGDDDMFLRVTQYLADLRSLPRQGLYWGRSRPIKPHAFTLSPYVWKRLGIGKSKHYITGPCGTLSRDVAMVLVSQEPLRSVIRMPYSKKNEKAFRSLAVQYEDVMVGVALGMSGYDIIYATENICRFHDRNDVCENPLSSRHSVMIHHITEEEYPIMMKCFEDVPVRDSGTFTKHGNRIHFRCS